MKLITAVIKPFMLDKLSRALTKMPITGFTVTDARGYGRGGEEVDLLTPRVRFEIVVLPEDVQMVSDLIFKTVSTHQDGDGIMFVTDVESVTNIRTGALNKEALVIK
jgi:nitrogen regulatory protein PII